MAIDNLRNSNQEKSTEFRKAKKPLMEKLRRARINESLNDLKVLVLESLQKDISQYSKMEKADILEMAVKHLKSLREENKRRENKPNDSASMSNYKSGYSECVQEVTRHVLAAEGMDVRQKESLFAYLSTRQAAVASLPPNPATILSPVPVTFAPAPATFASAPIPISPLYTSPSGTLSPYAPPPASFSAPGALSSYPSPPASPVNMGTQAVLYSPVFLTKAPIGTSLQHKVPVTSSYSTDAPAVWRPW